MWLLRRIKASNLEPKIIIDFYLKEIRIVAEHGVAIWNCGLTKAQSHTTEKIQKIALKIILGDSYTTYDEARSIFGLKLLSERRNDICIKFALKLYQSKYCKQFFTLANPTVKTRQHTLVIEATFNTNKGLNAPHNYLARLVNQNSERLNLPKN